MLLSDQKGMMMPLLESKVIDSEGENRVGQRQGTCSINETRIASSLRGPALRFLVSHRNVCLSDILLKPVEMALSLSPHQITRAPLTPP